MKNKHKSNKNGDNNKLGPYIRKEGENTKNNKKRTVSKLIRVKLKNTNSNNGNKSNKINNVVSLFREEENQQK